MEKKYILDKTDTKEINGITLYRIRAIRDFGKVKAGDFGGYIEKEENLSHNGNCWVYNTAYVYQNARITANAKITLKAEVYGNAYISDNAEICGAKILMHAIIQNNAIVFGEVSGNARILDNAKIFGKIAGNAIIKDNAIIEEKALIRGNVCIGSDSHISKNTYITI